LFPEPFSGRNQGERMTKLATAFLTPQITNYLPLLLLRGFILLPCIALSGVALAQTSTEQAPPEQKIQSVTTTVVVQGQVSDDYLPTEVSVGSLDSLPLASAPVSATVVTRDLMNDQVSRLLSDIVKNDASIGEDYAPVGYYGDYQIRGFAIDLATGLQINGMPIAGEQDVPLENKERVEFLKGIAGVESGITTAGGLINYVTKRPAIVKALDMATDDRGTAYAAVDLGQLLGSAKQFGVRANMAGEDIHTYVESANGWRGVGTLATDWKLSPVAVWKTDFEYQHKRERSVAGYQLLGGAVVPALNTVYPSVMLGNQIWSKPNIFDAMNGNSRLDLDVTPDWHVYFAGSYSHSLIDDNVIYPYGCYYEAECNVPGGPPPYFFAPDGTYDIYDYRDPGERRLDALGEGIAAGHVTMGNITHNLVFGGSIFHRGVDLPGMPGQNAPTTVQDGAVYTYIGSENIYQPNISYQIESPEQQAGPLTLADFDRQSSGIVQDRVDFPGHVRLTAGGRYASMTDFNFTGSKGVWLPQYSATYAPVANLTLYGNYNVMLSLGPQAPFWAINSSVYLAPFYTRQTEVGAKFEPGQRILLTTAFFRMRAPFFYPKVISSPDAFCASVTEIGQCFEADGHETHDGIEIGAQGKATNWLRLSATAAGILATSDDSSTAAFNGKQVINQPRLKTAVFADIAMPRVAGLHLSDFHLLPGWGYTGRKEATRDDAVSVGGYNLFNLGARYSPGGEHGRMSFRIFADNILDKRYWKDTGASYGDTFIHLGAPTTVRLSGQYRF
jgi:iron complex outermembrane recepter protein